jgi:23S rRNA (cytidine1920-2'-O)/16S rRNA (cytidine1409-2'-O)-methyltransferase
MNTGVKKIRLDRLLIDRELAHTRSQAQGLILSGKVWVDGRRVDKAGLLIPAPARLEIRTNRARYVGRGGLKLESALDHFGIRPDGWVAVDIGASTGGFTDCLLQRGAVRVYAVDVGRGQLHERLRADPRVTVMERTHIRTLDPSRISEKADLITVDVSFISLRGVLPKAMELMKPAGKIVALIKPQFEVGRGEVGKGGIVREPEKRLRVVREIREFAETLGLIAEGEFECPVAGQDGNLEYFVVFGSVAG